MRQPENFDIAIIGAGPAGMAAATEATTAGASVVLLDEAPRPGGQIYRDIGRSTTERRRILGPDYARGAFLVDELTHSEADYRHGATVWHIEALSPGYRLSYSTGSGSRIVDCSSLIVATGALERPMPLPGWTLPGVVTAGALQILLKSAGSVAEDAVLIGCGPLLLLIAAQMIDAGSPPKAILETVPRRRYLAALRHLPAALMSPAYLRKGMGLWRRIRQAGVPVYRDAGEIRLEGDRTLACVSFRSGGKRHRIDTTTAGLHHGIVPNQQITRLMRCAHHWDSRQHTFLPNLDDWGETSLSGLYVAGDGASVRGAQSAALSGRLAAIGATDRARAATPEGQRLRRRVRRDARIRGLLETLYAPAPQALAPDDATLVCRCEEISAGEIRHAVRHQARGPNQVKSFLRTGMGPCQGRVCGPAVTQLIAAESGEPMEAVGYFRIRPPLKPLALAELADYEVPDA